MRKVHSSCLLPLSLLLVIIIGSCGLPEKFKEMASLGIELQKEFDHDHVSVGFHIGDEDYWTIAFTDFDIDSYDGLKLLAEDVHEYLLEETDAERQDYVLVVFTPEDDHDDDTTQKVEFRFDN